VTAARRFAEQLACPSGTAGRLLGAGMDLANRKPNRLAIDQLSPRPCERVLDAGCGSGAGLGEVLRRAKCEVAGIDPSPVMIAAARRRLGARAELHCTGLEELPFAPASFDAALLLNVLYFCDEGGAMIANLRRVLRPGGRLVVYVTDRATMDGWAFARQGLHRLFDHAELVDALVAGGFSRDAVSVRAEPITRTVRGLIACAQA
jgi:SAM-dependent methyltransferase